MALLITTDCTNCTLCEPECPNGAIAEGEEYFEIDGDLCTECVGFNDTPACADLCRLVVVVLWVGIGNSP